ncbi:MAG TPA: hypothetical protein VFN61_07115 [Acidimicrobiales bacterium]|nr:hypothetical protein [Acidimicrobiales bacterium]
MDGFGDATCAVPGTVGLSRAAGSRLVCWALACAGCAAALLSATAAQMRNIQPLYLTASDLRDVALSAWVAGCVLVAISDLIGRRVPGRLSRCFGLLSAGALISRSGGTGGGQAVEAAVFCALVVGALFVTWYAAMPRAVGFADVRACTFTAATVGSFSVGVALVIAATAPFIGAVWSLAQSRRRLALAALPEGTPPARCMSGHSSAPRGAPLAAVACVAGAFVVLGYVG